MRKRAKPSEARSILRRVPLGISFWLCTNEQLRSLTELGRALEKTDDEVFRYHVNRDKNDFESWIREVIKDKELAREISRIKTRETLIRKIMERVEELKKIAKTAPKPKKARKLKKAKKGIRKRIKKRAKKVKGVKRRRVKAHRKTAHRKTKKHRRGKRR